MQVVKKHKAFDKRKSILNDGFTHLVTLPWKSSGKEVTPWNDVCADIIEVFGLPGNRFMSHATPDSMTFYFKTEYDASLCKVLISDKI